MWYNGSFKAKSFFGRQSSLESVCDCHAGNPGIICPSCESLGDSVRGYHSGTRSVIGLLFSCRPSAILFAVVAVIVNSFDGMKRRWALAHVCKESSKRISPFLANRNSSASIARILDYIFVVATLIYSIPRLIFWSFPKAMRSICCGSSSRKPFLLKASTTSCVTVFQNGSADSCLLPAVANANPVIGFIDSSSSTRFNGKATETLSNKIKRMSHFNSLYHSVNRVYALGVF